MPMPKLETMTTALIRATGDRYFNLTAEKELFGKLDSKSKRLLLVARKTHAVRGEILFQPSCSKFLLISDVYDSNNIRYLNILPADHQLADIQQPDTTYRAHLDACDKEGTTFVFAVPEGHPFTVGQTITTGREKMRITSLYHIDGIDRIAADRVW